MSRVGYFGKRIFVAGNTVADDSTVESGQGLRLVMTGIVIGAALTLGAARFLRSLLYNVSPHDPLTFVSVAVLLCLISLLAGEIPARRAMRIDPAAALRRD